MEKVKRREITETTFDVWNRLIGVSKQFIELHGKSNIKVPFSENLMQSEDYPSFLGLSLIEHNFNNIAQSLIGYANFLDRGLKDISSVKELLEERSYFLIYENARIILTLIAYLSTGNKRFLVPIDTCSFPELLENLVGYRSNCHYDFAGFQSVPSDVYFAVHELVKNARENLVNDGISVTFRLEDSNLVAIVKDNGTGISADKLPKIFGSYTDKEQDSGIGLQVVKRMVDLKGGYVDVISTELGKHTFKYDTKFGKVQRVGQPLTQEISGTYFILNFPKPQ